MTDQLRRIRVSDITLGRRHRKDMGDLKSLAASIKEEGLLQPIGVTSDMQLVFGERRLRAVKDVLKRKLILARIVDVTSIVAGEWTENEIRKDFTPSERVAIAKAIEKQMPERRGKRQHFDGFNGRTDAIAAMRAGFGNRQTYRQAMKVINNGSSKLVLAMDEGRVSISAASLLADAEFDEQDAVLELDPKAILEAAKEIHRRKADGIGGHEKPNRGETNDWLTPQYVLDALGEFDLDPCAALERPWATAKRHITKKGNGLKKSWSGRVWLNPPYGEQTTFWLEKMAKHQNGIVLIYARTETQMFFDHVWSRANGILFLKGRIPFIKQDGTDSGPAGAPSVLLSYDRRSRRRNFNCLKRCNLEGQFLEIR